MGGIGSVTKRKDEWMARHQTSPQERPGCRADPPRETRSVFPGPDQLLLTADPPMKENPYEDVELHGHCLGKKCVLNFPASPTSSIPDTPTKV